MSVWFKRTRTGTFRLKLGREEREALRWLCGQMRDLLAGDVDDGDPAVARLFPPAYGPDHEDKNAEYSRLMRDELLTGRLGALDVVAQSVDASEVTEDQLVAWMGALNDIRLVLGTRLEVTEDMEEVPDDDPRAPMFGLYQYLTWLQSDVIDALQEA